MRYSIITVTDGNFLVRSEWGDKASAFKAFHSLCAALWNDTGFNTAMVKVVDENLDTCEGKMELIVHEVQAQPAEAAEAEA